MIFALADTHLSLAEKTNKSMEVFGNTWHNYMQRIESECKNKIKEQDILIIPGDISWAMHLDEALLDLTFLHNLPGLKVLVRGNHDYWWTGIQKMHQFCEKNSLNSLLFTRFDALRFPLDEKGNLLGFVKSSGGNEATLFDKKLKNTELYQYFTSPSKETLTEESFGIVFVGTRSWLAPSESTFQKKDEKIYERECLRLEMGLKSAINLRREKDLLLTALHYPPLLKGYEPQEIVKILTKYEVDMCLSGHLHGYKARLVREGMYEGCSYLHVAADALAMSPLCVPLAQRWIKKFSS